MMSQQGRVCSRTLRKQELWFLKNHVRGVRRGRTQYSGGRGRRCGDSNRALGSNALFRVSSWSRGIRSYGGADSRPDILHQVTVTERFIVVDEVVKGGIFVFDRQNDEVSFLGDGFSGGHHLVYTVGSGDTLVVRPAFGFQAVDAHLKIDDNAMSFYNLTKKTVATRCYSWEIANHHPTDIHLHEGFLYLSFAIPGSVAKIELSTGRIVARSEARPDCFTRYASMVLDGFYYLLDYATMRNRYERTNLTLFLLAHSWAMGRVSGTRAGFLP